MGWDRSGGPHTGRVYAVWTQEMPNESDNTDIMFQYSDRQRRYLDSRRPAEPRPHAQQSVRRVHADDGVTGRSGEVGA